MSVSIELPRISIKNDVKRAEARPFVGKVVADALQDSKFDVEKKPYQWTLAVEPIKSPDGTKGFQIGGKTGAFWEYVAIPREAIEEGKISAESKFGRHFNSFKNTFGSDDDRAIGRGEYLNEVAWFIKDKVQYGTDKQTGAQIESTVLLAVRALTPEEMVEYGLAAGGTAPSAAMTFDEGDLRTLALALDGKDRNGLQKAAYQSKTLSNALRQGVGKGDGPAIKALLDAGLVSFDGDVLRAS
jgi:hypothetical protein